MSEQHSPAFGESFNAAPQPEPPADESREDGSRPQRVPVSDHIAAPPRSFGPPPQFSWPADPARHAHGSGTGRDDEGADAAAGGAHRGGDPRSAPFADEGHTSVMRLEGDPRIEAAREDYQRRHGPQQTDTGPNVAIGQDPQSQPWQQLPPRRVEPPEFQRPRPGWPADNNGHVDRRGPRPDAGPRPEPGPRRPEQYGSWEQSQGSAASWNYTDSIRAGELVPSRRTPPGRGWRKALYVGSGKLINPGQSPDERYEDELVAKCRTLLRGKYKIGILGKGGAGKSTTSAGVGSIFAELRQDDRVVAIDADTAFGKLASRVDPKASGSYWELAGDRHLHSFADIRARVGSNPAGLFVLGGDPATARRRQLDPDIYRQATVQLDRHFTLSIIDCGSTLDADITLEVLSDVDALIVVSSPWFDGASAAGQTLEWLAHNGYTALLARTVVVINDSDGHASKADLKKLSERFRQHGQRVIEMPYDEHLRPGGVVDVQSGVNKRTRRRFLELAAHCAEHFATTTDSPRGYQ